MLSKDNCCAGTPCTLTQIILNPALFTGLAVNQTDTSHSPVQPLKPQTHITSMGLETDLQPDELFLQNSTSHYQQCSRPWETKAAPTTISTFKLVQLHSRAQKRWNNDMMQLSQDIQIKKCTKATTEHRTKALHYPEPPLLQNNLRVNTCSDDSVTAD